GSGNTLLGSNTKATNGIQNATAIGANATVTKSDTLILGAVDFINSGQSVNVGIGTNDPASRLHVVGGDVYIATPQRSLILRTQAGFNCARLVIIDGTLQVTAQLVPCPAGN